MKFVIRTNESVVGTYEVEAESEEAALAKFGDPAIDWEGVEQVDYMAYRIDDVEIKEVAK